MQNMDSIDASKNKIFFKKRILRPWKPTLLENSVEEPFTQDTETPDTLNPIQVDTLLDAKRQEQIRLELEHSLEGKKNEHASLKAQLSDRDDNRILIGGFLSPKQIYFVNNDEEDQKANFLMNELEQEILSLAHDLKVAKAIEQAENSEISRRIEERARHSSEEKALYAIQQAKQAAAEAYKASQQLCIEKNLRLEEEMKRKYQEDRTSDILKELEAKEQKLIHEMRMRQEAEARIEDVFEQAKKSEHMANQLAAERIKKIEAITSENIETIKKDAEEQIKQMQTQVLESTQASQNEANERIAQMEAMCDKRTKEAQDRIRHIQMEADKKIQKAEDHLRFNEKSRLNAHNKMQKALELAQTTEQCKKEIEEQLEQALKLQGELTLLKTELETERNTLLQENAYTLQENALVRKELSEASERLKNIETVIRTERHLRKVLEERNAYLQQQMKDLEAQKTHFETRSSLDLEHNFTESKALLEFEQRANMEFESKIKEFMDKIHELEIYKQNECYRRQTAEEKVSMLIKEQALLKQDKTQTEDTLSKALGRLKELETSFETEKAARQDAEKARMVAEDKIARAIEQASKTVLNVLGGP